MFLVMLLKLAACFPTYERIHVVLYVIDALNSNWNVIVGNYCSIISCLPCYAFDLLLDFVQVEYHCQYFPNGGCPMKHFQQSIHLSYHHFLVQCSRP